MKKRNVVTQVITFLTGFILSGMVFSSASLADYGVVIQGELCGSNGGGGSTGPGYDDDPDGDTWAGYAHDVGLKYVKIGKKSSGDWDGSRAWTLGEIPEKRVFRIKVKRKGGEWKDTCAELWFSHNNHYTDDDLYLGVECKDLSDSEYDNYDEKSIYIKNIYLPSMEVGKNYYFFTVLKYDGGQNPSTESDHDEYVKIDVVEEGESPGSGSGINGYTIEQITAALQIISSDD